MPAVHEATTKVAGQPQPYDYDLAQYRPGRDITDWEPENELFWKSARSRPALWCARRRVR
ncbi:hypothetical protein AQI95_22755 [Streptomyces yokosukanensis]|uniref:Uncharacterized protein n=1 Tax=Streptomyces yokosukanensis TaxID=67386 RepID=A0A101P1R9_9ACTN|nr:hypothetical protein [Streptomyces yokosukanensis]KUN03340.1 hypothetical protein AQI95_22755 [Streptomyces yokosukanensis]